eukprot:5151822-Pyramimonas_sp.AAC.2
MIGPLREYTHGREIRVPIGALSGSELVGLRAMVWMLRAIVWMLRATVWMLRAIVWMLRAI